MNLASTDPVVAEKSIHHIKEAICLATMLGRPTYSFHAGFRINPQVCELGSKLSRYALVNRETSFGLFGERVLNLAEDARREGATLLIENNVINKRNLSVYGEDPLLLTHPDEIAKFMVGMPENVGLLLDVAHLKVSSGALNFNLEDAHETLKRWIKGYHLSDNNGEFDSNECVHTDSWFWDLLVSGLDYYSLEVYNTSTAKLYEQYKYTEMRLAKNMSSPKMMD